MGPQVMRGCRRGAMGLLAALALVVPLRAATGPVQPPREALQADLAPGLHYQRLVRVSPRPVVVHLVRIALRTPGLRLVVSPGTPGLGDGMESVAMTTREFAAREGLQLAVNASFFYPFREHAVWGYPRSGDPVNVVGQAVSNGQAYSADGESGWMTLCIDAQGAARITDQSVCPGGTRESVSGNALLWWQGRRADPATAWDAHKPYPRTVVGTERGGDVLWVVAVDGKQPGYSEGLTLPELTEILAPLGLEAALNLDGGGSTTLVAAGEGGPRLLNAPVHQLTPMLERPVANHLGVRFLQPAPR